MKNLVSIIDALKFKNPFTGAMALGGLYALYMILSNLHNFIHLDNQVQEIISVVTDILAFFLGILGVHTSQYMKNDSFNILKNK